MILLYFINKNSELKYVKIIIINFKYFYSFLNLNLTSGKIYFFRKKYDKFHKIY
jgi:hypothetical protein